MAEKMTEAQKREWAKFRAGQSAKLDVLERAGLVSVFTEITAKGTKLTRVESVHLTPAGRSALASTGGTDGE